MAKLALAALLLSGCGRAWLAMTHPETHGTKWQRDQWAGVSPDEMEQCERAAQHACGTAFSVEGFVTCDGAKPVSHCVCIPLSTRFDIYNQ